MGWSKKRKAVAPVEVLENPEDWDYFDYGELTKTKTSRVCMTCEHFTYASTKSCVTLLTCPIHQRLIPQGEHLNKRCKMWMKKRELVIGYCPEVA
tara:strand:+ start:55 stop:339 length:285 start_codon:yes stop_codon:yes gene_type:complete